MKTLGYENAQTTWINAGLCGFRSACTRPVHSIDGTAPDVSSPRVFKFTSINLNKTFCFLEKRLRQGFGWNANPQSKRVNEAQSGVDPKRSERFRKETKGFIQSLQLARQLLIFLIAFLMVATSSRADMVNESTQKATFAGGCFWGIEKYFSKIPGVISTRVGYTGGAVKNPSYEQVCTGTTGHAEAIEVTYDPQKLRYEDLLEFFFRHHDPTTLDRQGPDIGTQYRSAIFTHSSEQAKLAQKAKEILEQAKIFKKSIVTEITPASEFYAAEDYHQKYLEKNPHGYCSLQVQSKKIGEVLRASWEQDPPTS